MKIPDLFPKITEQPNDTRQCRDQGEKVKGSFANILQKTASSDAGNAVPVLPGLPLLNTSNLTPAQDTALAAGQQTLDLLDHCGNLLTDPGFSQDGFKTLSQAMTAQSDRLGTVRNELDKDDPLRDTIDRIRLLSTVESIKLDRGDYSG